MKKFIILFTFIPTVIFAQWDSKNIGVSLNNAFTGTNTFSGVTTFTGNVGIGRTPTLQFDIATSGATSAFFGVAATGSGTSGLYIDASNGDFSGQDFLTIRQDNSLNGYVEMGLNGGALRVGTLGSDALYFIVAGIAEYYINPSTGFHGFGNTNATPQHYISIYDATPGLFGTDTDININRTSAAAAIDSAAYGMNVDANGNGYVYVSSGIGGAISWLGQQPTTYSSSTNQMWVSAGADTLFVRLGGNAFFLELTDLSDTH